MDRTNVHRFIASGLKVVICAAICLLGLSILPVQQTHSQAIDGWPTEQALPAELSIDHAPQTPFTINADAGASASQLIARAYVPIVTRAGTIATPRPESTDPIEIVNAYRIAAGVPAVTLIDSLSNNCWYHSRYMAEENEIAHSERTNSPWYSAEGQSCGQNSNVWLGGEYSKPIWQPIHAINGWMDSVGHRMWLLYPTTPAFGFSFYTASNNRAGSALDVLSRIDTSKDLNYAGWPVRYPAPNQTGIPAQAYSITLGWRYFGAAPTVSSVSLTANGNPIPASYTTSLPVGHKGIEIRPSQSLPANSTINVSVTGSYDGKPFNYQWSFKTAS